MASFLDNLAARGLGLLEVVEPRRPSRFERAAPAGEPWLATDAGTDDLADEAVIDPGPRPVARPIEPPARSPHPAEGGRATPPTAPDQPDPSPSPRITAADEHEPHGQPHSRPVDRAALAPPPAIHEPAMRAPEPRIEIVERLDDIPAARTRASERRRPAATEAGQPRQPAAPHAAIAGSPQNAPASGAQPGSLVTPVPADDRAARGASAGDHLERLAARSDTSPGDWQPPRVRNEPPVVAIASREHDAPVIQVTIGRVELRATPPAPATPARMSAPPRPRPRLTLDAYLDRQGRGGR